MPISLTPTQASFLATHRAATVPAQAEASAQNILQMQALLDESTSLQEIFQIFFDYEHAMISLLEDERSVLDGQTYSPTVTLSAITLAAGATISDYFPQFWIEPAPRQFPSLMGTAAYSGTNEAPIGYLPALTAEQTPKSNANVTLATTGTNYAQMYLAKQIRLAALQEEENAIHALTDPGGVWDLIVADTDLPSGFRSVITALLRQDYIDELTSPSVTADIAEARAILNSVSIPPSGTGPAITYDYTQRLARITDRLSTVSGRLAAVLAELATGRYDRRYLWVNAMLHRAYGTLTDIDGMQRGIDAENEGLALAAAEEVQFAALV